MICRYQLLSQKIFWSKKIREKIDGRRNNVYYSNKTDAKTWRQISKKIREGVRKWISLPVVWFHWRGTLDTKKFYTIFEPTPHDFVRALIIKRATSHNPLPFPDSERSAAQLSLTWMGPDCERRSLTFSEKFPCLRNTISRSFSLISAA